MVVVIERLKPGLNEKRYLSTGMLRGKVTSAIEAGMTYSHSRMYDSVSKGSHHSSYCYSWAWLMPIEVVYLSSRPCLYQIMPSRLRFGRPSACPRLGGAVEAGSCQARSSRDGTTIGEALGPRSGPGRRRSGVLIAKVIVVPSWTRLGAWLAFRARQRPHHCYSPG